MKLYEVGLIFQIQRKTLFSAKAPLALLEMNNAIDPDKNDVSSTLKL